MGKIFHTTHQKKKKKKTFNIHIVNDLQNFQKKIFWMIIFYINVLFYQTIQPKNIDKHWN